MAKKTQIIGGITQQFYHTIPNDLDLIITTPHKESIFEFLSQIGFDKFPEFIRDVLVKIENHTLIDITDGPGDEKQDILTITPEGKRCLTQCKHSIHINSHNNGDELDLLVAACLRKDCKEAFFVTNTDLTPQAKRYVTDKEYLRGWPDPLNPLKIDYWNDNRIWGKIKSNTDILNKWFGNLGQTHGLRSFKFELSVLNMPIKNNSEKINHIDILINKLINTKKIHILDDLRYKGVLPSGTSFIFEKWFLIPSKLNINYFFQEQGNNYPNQAQNAISIEVTVPHEIKFSPSEIRKDVIDFLSKDELENLSGDNWWIITASQAKSFIFLHDIGETRQITLNNAGTFIKDRNEIISEIEHINLNADYYEIKETDDVNDSIFVHKSSNIQVIQLFDQIIDPSFVYEQQLIQKAHIENYYTYSFKAIEGIDSHMLMRIRRILNHEWVAIQVGDDTIIWGYPFDSDINNVNYIEEKLKVLGLVILEVDEESRDTILSNLSFDMPPPTYQILSELNNLSFPIDLRSRTFWLSKNLPEDAIIDEAKALKLLQFKYYIEDIHGHKNLGGKETLHTHTSELPNLLADIMTFRGRRMLDIGILNKPYSINVRFRDGNIENSTFLADKYISEFNAIYDEIASYIITNKEMDFDKFNS